MKVFINGEAIFPPKMQLQESQKFNITDRPVTEFCFDSFLVYSCSDPQCIQNRIRKASWKVWLFDQGHCWSSAQLPLVHFNGAL